MKGVLVLRRCKCVVIRLTARDGVSEAHTLRVGGAVGLLVA